MAYWRLLHATDRTGSGAVSSLTPDRLRMLLGKPATLGDLVETWLMTRPKPKQGNVGAMLRDAGADQSAIDFWGSSDD